ncbi:type II secretion system protein [Alicyclobacillus fructus]|uniref:type II secretion system protein n=1 Tax=Alicyclobacillus fructus TaxID=2816082 RepID=UPI001A8C1B87|nr:type II secretion system protein [Alicyclobacillus fructus]
MRQIRTKISDLKKRARDQRGVTLIEMLAVVVILAILAAVGVPIVLAQIQKARVNTDKSNEQLIADALQRAEYDYQSNSTNQGSLYISTPGAINGNTAQISNGTNTTAVYSYLLNGSFSGNGTGYITSIPNPQSQTGNFSIVANLPSGYSGPSVTFTYPSNTNGTMQTWYVDIQ